MAVTNISYNDLSPAFSASPIISFAQAMNRVLAPAACKVYRDNPNVGFQFIPGGSSTPFGQIQRAYMESLCAPYGGTTPVNPPSSGFTGGQCPLQYTVNYSVDYTQNGGAVQTYSSYTYIYGKIRGISVYGEGTSTKVDINGGSATSANDVVVSTVVTFTNTVANGYRYFNARITSVTPRSGGPDTCGDYPSPTYPSRPTNINLPDININLGNNNVTLTGGTVSFNVNASIPVQFNFAPQLKIDFGFDGIRFDFPDVPGDTGTPTDLTPVLNAIAGVQTNLNDNVKPKIDNVQGTADSIKQDTSEIIDSLEEILNEIKNVVEVAIGHLKEDTEQILSDIENDVFASLALLQQATITDIPATLTQIRADIAALDFDCVCPDIPDETSYTYSYTRVEKSSGTQTGEFSIFASAQDGEPYAVELVIDTVPANAKVEKGALRKDVYYAGWSTFGVYLGNVVHREPIHFLRNVRLAPENARGFVWALKEGYTCTCTLVYRKKNPVQGGS